MRSKLVVLSLFIALAVFIVASESVVMAAGSRRPGSHTSATLAVTPNPVPAYSTFQISGCGYPPNSYVTLNLRTNFGVATTAAVADLSGCLSNANWSSSAPGTYKLEAWTGSRKLTLSASVAFIVY